ncbi:probable methyltransferase-like protein 24 [Ylistrum balloti]|uniref:probable methyltransferase-like protein 24 n=1 Tax=Ylistrum balloti TaxID=509963 RepID=UPI002905D8B8|nr:probable methyltransferase-like protein 24 [Ylistrum balloti]
MSKSVFTYPIRQRSRITWLWMLIVVALVLLLLRRQHRVDQDIADSEAPTPTPFNRTLWDAKSIPRKFVYPKCPASTSSKRNVDIITSLKKTLDIPDGPPPGKKELCSMSFEDLELYYHTYLSTVQSPCKRSVRIGNTLDGGWDVCGEEARLERNSCLVYSFGIQFDFSFDDEIASVFGCEVHSFDPSMHQEDHRRSQSVFFHATGIADYSGVSNDMAGWKMRTYQAIREELQHVSRTPDVIKMDIEGWEWNALPDMLKSSYLSGVKQLLVEFHSSTDSHVKEYWVHKLSILRDLYFEGYRVFWVGRNMMCTYTSPVLHRLLYGCYEVSFVRVN